MALCVLWSLIASFLFLPTAKFDVLHSDALLETRCLRSVMCRTEVVTR